MLLRGESVQNILGAGFGLSQMGGDNGAFIVVERGHSGKNTAQRHGYVIDVIHQADCFSGEWLGWGSSIGVVLTAIVRAGGGGCKGGAQPSRRGFEFKLTHSTVRPCLHCR